MPHAKVEATPHGLLLHAMSRCDPAALAGPAIVTAPRKRGPLTLPATPLETAPTNPTRR
jgi:hypothetical protein